MSGCFLVAVDFQSLPGITGDLVNDVQREPLMMSAGRHLGI